MTAKSRTADAAPQPVAGLVLRYAFLWGHEAEAGLEEGNKDRSCAVLLTAVTKKRTGGRHLLPVTHTPPADPRLAVEIPASTKARLGLENDRSWIVLTEANRFQWPGPDLRPVQGAEGGNIAYGFLPASLYDLVRTKWLAVHDAGLAGQVDRTS